MNDQTNMAQLRYLEELKISLVHAGFEPERIEDQHLPVRWENHYLCRVSGKGSMLYRQECVDVPGAQDALQAVIDTACNDFGIHGDSGNRPASQGQRSHRRLPRPCGLRQRGAGGPPHRARRPVCNVGVGLGP